MQKQKWDFVESRLAKGPNAHKVGSGYYCELEAQSAVDAILVTLLKLFLYGSKNKDSALIKHNCEHFRLADGQTMLQFKDSLKWQCCFAGHSHMKDGFFKHAHELNI